jgi:hypothetical protein
VQGNSDRVLMASKWLALEEYEVTFVDLTE